MELEKPPERAVFCVLDTPTPFRYAPCNMESQERRIQTPEKFEGLKHPELQVRKLAEALKLSPDKALRYVEESLPRLELPEEAEGWLAIPGKFFEEKRTKILEEALRIIDARNYIEPGRISRTERTAAFLPVVSVLQDHSEVLVVPVQTGDRFRGESVRGVRKKMSGNEYGLGALEVVSLLLTHPERAQFLLNIDCPGDEYPVADGDFSGAPIFRFDTGRVRFDAYWCDVAFGRFGSASAFLPQERRSKA